MRNDISIRIEFGPDDPLNPECGFYFKAESKRGTEMHTHRNPDTQEPLTAQDCIALAEKLYRLNSEGADDYKAGRDAGVEAAAQRCEKSGYVNGAYHAALVRRDA
jgi:hypothetical protein